MSIDVTETTVKNILTRTSGYLRTVASHSLQPYRGCTFGNSLCGVGCYVRHNGHVVRGRRWGGFLEVRTNAAASYLANYEREARWARRVHVGIADSVEVAVRGRGARFSIFCSSSTDPFVPQERRCGVTQSLLEAMRDAPPDELVLQTHTHLVTEHLPQVQALSEVCDLRVHVSIETDRDSMPGLPPHASSVDRRFAACRALRAAGVRTVVTVSPLLPIDDPDAFFARIAESADAVVIDHYIGGDGSPDGRRTERTPLPAAMRDVNPASLTLEYRNRMIEVANAYLPDCVGVGHDGFAGRYL